MRCIGCLNRRRFSARVRAHLSPWSWALVCYPCWMRRRARLHIAGRVALLLVAAAFIAGSPWAVCAAIRALFGAP